METGLVVWGIALTNAHGVFTWAGTGLTALALVVTTAIVVRLLEKTL